MYAEQPVTSPDSNARHLNGLHNCFGLYHYHFEMNCDIYYKYGSYFQCFCATVFEKLSHPKSEAVIVYWLSTALCLCQMLCLFRAFQ